MGVQSRQNISGILIQLYKDPDRKSILRMIFEAINLTFIYRELPKHYFSRLLFKKRIRNYKDYLPYRYSSDIAMAFNDSRLKDVLDNKLSFDIFFRKHNFPLPLLLMYNERNVFLRQNQRVEVDSLHGFTELLKDIFRKNPDYGSIIVKKTAGSSSGKNIFRVSSDMLSPEKKLEDIYRTVVDSEFIFQETVRQHPVLNTLNPACLNTMRFDTFTDRDGKIEIMSCYIRMCLNNAHVDNISAGGCLVGVAIPEGTLKKYAYSTTSVVGVRELTRHPVTGTVFENYAIPYFKEACDMVLKAAVLNQSLRLVGWDIAISETGPVLIEGNSDYVIAGNDVAYGGYRSNPVFMKVLDELKRR